MKESICAACLCCVVLCDLVSAPFHLSSLTFGCTPPLSDHHLRKAHFSHQKSRCDFFASAGWSEDEEDEEEAAVGRSLILPLAKRGDTAAAVCVFDHWSNYGYVFLHKHTLNADVIWALRAPLMPCLLKIPPFFAAASHAAGYI